MSSTLATSNEEGSSSSALFSATACRGVNLPHMGTSKPESRKSFLPNIFFISSIDLSFPCLIVKDLHLSL